MVIAIAGYNGFIGRHIQKEMSENEFIFLGREDIYGEIETLARKIESADVLINVAGQPVASRWTKKTRELVYKSRVEVTQNLVRAVNINKNKPVSFLCASAIGLYEFGDEHTEESKNFGDNFLSEVVQKWEKAAVEMDSSVNTVIMRIGLVLGNDGGALPRLIGLFRIGLGGVIASGKQVYSFIHVNDVTGAIKHLLKKGSTGVYNFTSPQPVENKEFTKVLAKALKRPALFRVPAFALQLYMGEAAMVVTKGQTVYPGKLQNEGYKFTFASINQAINNLVRNK